MRDPQVILLCLVAFLHAVYAASFCCFPIDDTFIHFAMARNLAEGLGFGVNPGEPVYATTAPAWTALLAGAYIISGGRLQAASAALGIALSSTMVLAFAALLRRFIRDPALVVLGTVALAAQAFIARWAPSGMEVPLVLLVLVAILVVYADDLQARRLPWRTGLLAATGLLARPEMVWLVPGIVLGTSWHGERRWPRLGALAAGLGGPIVLFEAFAISYWGTPLPTSFTVKCGTHPFLSTFLSFWNRVAGASPVLGLALLVGLIAWLWRRPRQRETRPDVAPHLPAIMFPALFLAGLLISRPIVFTRYCVIIVPVLALYAFVLLDQWTDAVAKERRRRTKLRAGLVVAGACLAYSVAVAHLIIRPHLYIWSRVRPNLLRAATEYIRANTPADAEVAAVEIGVLSYYGERRIYDLFGLLGQPSAHQLSPAGVSALLESRRIAALLSTSDATRAALLRGEGSLHLPPLTKAVRDRITRAVVWEGAVKPRDLDRRPALWEDVQPITVREPGPPEPTTHMQRYSVYVFDWNSRLPEKEQVR